MGDRWRRDGCDDRHERHGQSRMALAPTGKRGTGHTPQITDHRVLRRRQARTVRAPGCQAHTPTSTTLRTRIYSPAPIASPRRPRRPDRYCPHDYGTTRERTRTSWWHPTHQLWKVADPVGPDNDKWLHAAAAEAQRTNGYVIAAWGAHARPDRVQAATAVLGSAGPIHCLGTTKAGAPRHPLYLRNDSPLLTWPAVSSRTGESHAA